MNFKQLRALGYENLVPIIPPDAPISPNSTLHKRVGTHQDGRGKTPGVKGRDGNWFSFDWVSHQCDDADLDRWDAMCAGGGIKTGNGILAIDADALDEAHALIIRDKVKEHFGDDLPIRVGRYPKALYLLRVTDPFPYARVEFGDRDEKGNASRVEVLEDRKQFVVFGIHPKTRKPYHWPKPLCHFDDLPLFRPEQIEAFMQDLARSLPMAEPKVIREGSGADVNQDTLRGDAKLIRKAVSAMPNTTDLFPARENYLAIGYAIKAALPDDEPEAFDIWADWCDRWQDGDRHNDPDIYRSDWQRMKGPFKRGASFIYETAEQASDGQFRAAEAWFSPVSQTEHAAMTIFDQIAQQEQQDAAEPKAPPIIAGAVNPSDLDILPPREWLYGTKILRKYTAFVAAPGGVGKTAFIYGLALSCASGRALLHDKPHGGKPLNVWIYNLEDDLIELRRRLKAAVQHHEIDPEALKHLRLNSGRDRGMKIVKTGSGADAGFVVQPDYHMIIEEMRREKIDILIVDPFLRSHGVSENDNEAQDEVMRLFAQIAQETNAAIVLVHHTKKGAIAGDLDSMRGGSTQGGGARSAYTLAPMSSEEAARVGVPDEERRLYVRIDDAKSNMAPPLARTEWLKLESVCLGNGAGAYPGGDNVQVATAWSLPDAWEGVGDHETALLLCLRDGMENGERYSIRPQDRDRWAGDVIVDQLSKTPEQAKTILAAWLKEGRIETREYQSPTQRKMRKGLYVTSAPAGDIFG